MKKIRINELARELEVKPGVILDLLPDLGVQEKKTHSSSIDEDVALALRDKLVSSGIPRNGAAGHDDDDFDSASEEANDSEDDSRSSSGKERSAFQDARREEGVAPAIASSPVASSPSSPATEGRDSRNLEQSGGTLTAELPRPSLPSGPMVRHGEATPGSPASSSAMPATVTQAPGGHATIVQASPNAPLRPPAQRFPLAAPAGQPAAPPLVRGIPLFPSKPLAEAASTTAAPSLQASGAPESPASDEAPKPKFQPLRPPLGSGSALQPPLAQPGAPVFRSHGVPARPIAPRPAPSAGAPQRGSGVTPSGPRQPLPPDLGKPSVVPSRPAFAQPGAPATPSAAFPAPPSQASPLPAQTTPTASQNAPSVPAAAPPLPPRAANPGTPALPRMPIAPTHVIAPGAAPSATPGAPPASFVPAHPGPAAASPANPLSSGSGPNAGGPSALSTSGSSSLPVVPGAPAPSRPATPRPPSALTPGAPIVPRSLSARPPLAGQPPARMVVPPRPDLVQRLKQQQAPPSRPGMAATPLPASPRPGVPPARPAGPAPGRPLYTGPVRPGQPLMRGPGSPAGPGNPGLPPSLQPRRPGMRSTHPTSALRPESATPMPVDTQRRHQAKPGFRQGPRKRETEGNLRERGPKRSAFIEPPPIDREITVAEGVTIKELSEKLGVKANLVIKKLVETKKVFATINQTLDIKLAEELAREFGASTNQVSYEQESTQDVEQAEQTDDVVRRAPVVTIMGHVDHGKTSLLDAIRDSNVAGREAGGITQHIGAYHIEKNGKKIVFIDTPGHQAFTRMRARGAKVTDIVVLVVSADDGVMPQTLEAIDHARAAKVPILVAINKIDKPGAQLDRVKQQLSDRGLLAEDWGGDVVMVPVSAKTGQNLDLLLEMILLVAEIQDLKANPARPATGTVLEAKLDRGRGPVATMLVRNGTLRAGEFLICGALFSKVRAMFDDRGNSVKEAEPSMPVEVIGLDSLPEVGDSFQVVSDTSKAKQIVIYREQKAREMAMARGARVATLDSLAQQFKEGDLKDLNLIIKADVGGTAEVLSDTLQQLSNDKVRVRVLRGGVGAISEDDVLLASASEALVIGFNVKIERNAQATADQQKVEIRQHSIIYELIDDVQRAMTGMLDPVFKETIQGHAEVRETFKISKVGTIAGCYVSDGSIRRDSQVRIMRGTELLHTGKIEALKRFKNDASEVKNGTECGISLVNFNNINVGDIIEAFAMERVAVEVPVSR